ncbi:MAG: PEGA domain-containing protein [Proteobacteria bacterium]|nr:PEGA domain-containing protein [Pseudomonadota bacterium]
MHRQDIARLASLTGLLALGACATATRGTTNQIQINSEPPGASVTTSLNQQCTTPCTITVSRKDEFSVVFSLPGYEDQTIAVKTQVAGAGAAGFAGNVLVGGVVGMGVDAVTGSTLEHQPNPVIAVMRKLAPAPKADPKARRAPAPKARATPAPKAEKPAEEGEG